MVRTAIAVVMLAAVAGVAVEVSDVVENVTHVLARAGDNMVQLQAVMEGARR